MRFIEIAVLLFVIQIGIGLANGIGMFAHNSNEPVPGWSDDINQEYWDAQELAQENPEINAGYALQEGWKGFITFFKAFVKALVFLPGLFRDFGVPWAIAFVVSTPIYLIYSLAIIQLLTKQPTGG